MLHAIVHSRKVNVSMMVASKLNEVAKSQKGAIRMGGVVLALASHVGFDLDSISFPKCKGGIKINTNIMMKMGLTELLDDSYVLKPHPRGDQPPQVHLENT